MLVKVLALGPAAGRADLVVSGVTGFLVDLAGKSHLPS
jgi:hypothetical protein